MRVVGNYKLAFEVCRALQAGLGAEAPGGLSVYGRRWPMGRVAFHVSWRRGPLGFEVVESKQYHDAYEATATFLSMVPEGIGVRILGYGRV